MPKPLPLPHFETFARLRAAELADLPTLVAFDASVSTGPAAHASWRRLLSEKEATVTLAMECDAIVGAAVMLHRDGDAVATLEWLSVSRSARRRGIGRLLLEAAVADAGNAGAGVLRVKRMPPEPAFALLLASEGFRRNGPAGGYEQWLWVDGAAAGFEAANVR